MNLKCFFSLTLILIVNYSLLSQLNNNQKEVITHDIYMERGRKIYFSGDKDPSHGLGFSMEFAKTFVDGPILHGYEGGALGANKLGTETIALKWTATGNVLIPNKLEAKEVKITNTPTADFVFEDRYHLSSLQDVENHIKEYKHLPEIASAKEMKKNGVNLGEFQIKLLQKIEELTLYIIRQEKEIHQIKKDIKQLKYK